MPCKPLRETPDGMDRFGYLGNSGLEYWVNILPYEKLRRDAKLNNAIFFERVSLAYLDTRLADAARHKAM